MRDHGEAAQAEQVGAAVRVGVEALAEPPRRRPDQQPAELSQRRRGDLLAQGSRGRPVIVPSRSLRATLPVKPSVTTTSAACRQEVAAFRVACERGGRWRRAAHAPAASSWLPFSGSSPIESSRTRGLATSEDLLGEDDSHVRELDAGARVARRRSRRRRAEPTGRSLAGIVTAIAGRRTPGEYGGSRAGMPRASRRCCPPRRPHRPSLPPPHGTRSTSELFGFDRTASVGFSSMAITSGASISSSPWVSRSSARRGSA